MQGVQKKRPPVSPSGRLPLLIHKTKTLSTLHGQMAKCYVFQLQKYYHPPIQQITKVRQKHYHRSLELGKGSFEWGNVLMCEWGFASFGVIVSIFKPEKCTYALRIFRYGNSVMKHTHLILTWIWENVLQISMYVMVTKVQNISAIAKERQKKYALIAI